MFKIGDKVKVVKDVMTYRINLIGKIGIIKSIDDGFIGVEFPTNVNGHSLKGDCEHGFGWFLHVNHLEKECDYFEYLYENHPTWLTITTKKGKEQIKTENFHINGSSMRVIQNNNVVIVILNDGTKGVAKCSEEDDFDFYKGYRIAVARAMIKQSQKELKKLCK